VSRFFVEIMKLPGGWGLGMWPGWVYQDGVVVALLDETKPLPVRGTNASNL
jgi:hypothetical protein